MSSFGEMLLPIYKEVIERVFNTRVFNTYGSSEGLMIAAECVQGNMHQMSNHVIVELLDDDDKEVEPGQIGRVIVTGLDNLTTPLIRYEIGDLVLKPKEVKCSCHLPYPLFGEVIGRTSDMLETPKGNYITVQTVVRVLKHFDGIDQFRFVQLSPHQFKLEYIPNKSFLNDDLNRVKSFFGKNLNEELNIEFQEVSEIEKAPSGKQQLIKNMLKGSIKSNNGTL